MSGLQEIWIAGMPAGDVDMQRMATAAAGADELTEEILLDHTTRLGGFSAGVVPILPDYYTAGVVAPQVDLVMPLPGGFLSVQPCHVSVAASPGDSGIPEQSMASIHAVYAPGAPGPDVVTSPGGLSGTLRVPTSSPQFAAGDLTNPRIDLLYLTIQRTVTFSQSRRFKSPQTGEVSTFVQPLAQDVTITVNIAQGTPASSPTPPALPTPPAGAWNVPIADVTIPSGYTVGATIPVANVAQVWRRLWLAPGRTRTTTPATIMATAYASATNGRGSARLDSQYGVGKRVAAVFQHASAFSTPIVFDNSIDWSRRRAQIKMMRLTAVGGVSMPLETTTASSVAEAGDSGPVWIPDKSAGFAVYTYAGSSPTSIVWTIDTTTGELLVGMNYTPHASAGDVWHFEVEASDKFTA